MLVFVSKSTALRGRVVSEVEGGCRDVTEELSLQLAGGTEKNHEHTSQVRKAHETLRSKFRGPQQEQNSRTGCTAEGGLLSWRNGLERLMM
jgi:hypothetical protein